MKLTPLGSNVVIRPMDAEEVTAGGIVLPDSAQEQPKEGRVLSIGDGKVLADGSRGEPQVSEGDRVVYSSYAGSPVQIEGEDLLIMSEDDILAVVA